jgi:hypothetical protein
LFDHCETLFSPAFQLPLPNHMCELDTRQHGLCGLEGIEPQHRARDPLHGSMILLHDIIAVDGCLIPKCDGVRSEELPSRDILPSA